MARMSCSEPKAPETRSASLSSPVCSVPAGLTAFCARSAAMTSPRSMPSPAIFSVENSTMMVSSWVPRISTLDTSGTRSSRARTSST